MTGVVHKGLWIPTLVLASICLCAQEPQKPQKHHWEETETETIWRVKNSNCDYGYYVNLPKGVIAHGTHSPNPNHGFLVALPDVGKTSPETSDDPRYVWVNAEYDMSESEGLIGAVDYFLIIGSSGNPAWRVVNRSPTTLAGIAATRLRLEYDNPSGRVLEEVVVALRSRIVYEIGLRTRPSDYDRDHSWFERIERGFRLLDLPKGDCTRAFLIQVYTLLAKIHRQPKERQRCTRSAISPHTSGRSAGGSRSVRDSPPMTSKRQEASSRVTLCVMPDDEPGCHNRRLPA